MPYERKSTPALERQKKHKSCWSLKACKSLKMGGGAFSRQGVFDPLVMVGIYTDWIANFSNFRSNVQSERFSSVPIQRYKSDKHFLLHFSMTNERAFWHNGQGLLNQPKCLSCSESLWSCEHDKPEQWEEWELTSASNSANRSFPIHWQPPMGRCLQACHHRLGIQAQSIYQLTAAHSYWEMRQLFLLTASHLILSCIWLQ